MSFIKFNCYLCGNKKFRYRKGKVRDLPSLKIIECSNCQLVTLNTFKHIKDDHYINSKMHGKDFDFKKWKNESYRDDLRRIKQFKRILKNKSLLDFGCGAGGFLELSNSITAESSGFELDLSVKKFWKNKLKIYDEIDKIKSKFDVITMFHVLEHLKSPIETLIKLKKNLKHGGVIIIEVPNADDALIKLYKSKAFQNFTYWSNHLYLYNPINLKKLLIKTGYKVKFIKNIQRYPISNHLHWLSKGKPGGHEIWNFFDNKEINDKYSKVLSKLNMGDTLIAKIINA